MARELASTYLDLGKRISSPDKSLTIENDHRLEYILVLYYMGRILGYEFKNKAC